MYLNKNRKDNITTISLYETQVWRMKDRMRSLKLKRYHQYIDHLFLIEDIHYNIKREKSNCKLQNQIDDSLKDKQPLIQKTTTDTPNKDYSKDIKSKYDYIEDLDEEYDDKKE